MIFYKIIFSNPLLFEFNNYIHTIQKIIRKKMYDINNIFYKIINKEIETDILFEDDALIAIKDIAPAADVHLLVIPKKEYVDYDDFVNNANAEEIVHYFKMLDFIAKKFNANDYRLVSNKGGESGQSVFHFHTHILSGLHNKNLTDENL